MRKPPLHFSNFNSHRGTTHTLAGAAVGALAGKTGGGPGGKAHRAFMRGLAISSTPLGKGPPRTSTRPGRRPPFLTNRTQLVSTQRRALLQPPSRKVLSASWIKSGSTQADCKSIKDSGFATHAASTTVIHHRGPSFCNFFC